MTPKEIDAAISELETSLERLHSLYNQYFTGIEKLEPTVPRKAVDRKIYILKREQIRNTAQRFRLQTQIQKYNTQSTYWRRVCRQIEEGTYQRHIMLAKHRQEAKRQKEEEAKDTRVRDTISELIDLKKDPLPSFELDLESQFSLDELGSFSLDEPFFPASNKQAQPNETIGDLDDPFNDGAWLNKPAAPVKASPVKPQKKPPEQLSNIDDGDLKEFFNSPMFAAEPQQSKAPVPVERRPEPAQPSRKRSPKVAAQSRPVKARQAAKPANQGQLDDKHARAIYRTYITARKKCAESTENLSLEKVTKSLRKKLDATGGDVDFKVVIRNGKAAIKTVKKKG
ncbi:MAG: hypothetical protein GY847_37185 [Proteobacteria bacterium]|nr:hypothetical protein [Pseudomonadota bacterium]